MENVINSSRKTVVCRYFAASGNCFFGEGCQFLHGSGQTFSNLASQLSLNSSESNVINSKSIENKQHFASLRTIAPLPLVSQEGFSQRTQELQLTTSSTQQQQLSGPLNSSTHFEENIGGSNIGGTTYYYSPDETAVPEIEDHIISDHNGHGTASKLHSSRTSGKQTHSLTSSNNTSQHSFYAYAGPPSFLQNPSGSGLQRTSFFMNEELRNDLIQRNSVAISTVDVALFPDLPQEVDHYNELVPLEVHTLNRAVKSQTYGWITSTYKATHINTGLRYCLKRIHGYRVTSAKCMSIVELWRKIQQCHLVTLREVFTTKAFGDHSMIFVYDYFPGAETLMTKHLSSTTSHTDPFSSDPSVPRPYSMQKNRMLQQQAGKGMIAESLLWSYIIELCSALRCVHSAGLAVRAMDPSKVLVTSRGRLRLCGGGIFDVLTYDTINSTYTAMVPHYQQEDLLALGKLILALACNSLLALQRDNVSTSMDIINKNYSSDLRNLIMYLLSSSQGSSRSKNIQEVMPMIGARFFSQLETTSLQADILEDQLARELDNGRLFRLLGKLGTVVDRPEFNMDASWAETGDRYLLKLFRDYVLHPCSEDGRPWIDLAHVIACLNRLETASHDKICLTSRDHQNVLVVSYAELHHCLETSFAELQLAATSAVTAPAHGANASQLEKEIGSEQFPPDEHYFGLVNFGNTCYSNSVLQALYFCKPFREKVLEYKMKNKQTKETLLTCLADLFYKITKEKKKVGTIAPKKFINRLKKEKEEFDNYMQQDAHEFLNFLINHISENLSAERKQVNGSSTASISLGKVRGNNKDGGNPIGSLNTGTSGSNGSITPNTNNEPTWVHEIFQGILTSETRCLNCETVSNKEEDFFDLQVDVDQNTSITHCLRTFSSTETLCTDNKFSCDVCSSYQEAQKCMRVKKLPVILALHLKRFKYVEQYNRHIKVSHRVVFPLELRLFNTSEECPDRLYDLVSVVVHCGSGPNRGHYISIVKSHDFWLLFDDDIVDKIDPSALEDFYGLTSDIQKASETGYILFYQSRDVV